MYEKLTMIINSQRKLKLGGLFSKLIQLIPNIYSFTALKEPPIEKDKAFKVPFSEFYHYIHKKIFYDLNI